MESKDVSSEILQARLEALRAENVRLISECLEKDKLLVEALAEKDRLLEETERLRHQLNQLLQDKFGTKSEKSKNLPDETFDEATKPENILDIETTEQEIFIAAHQRKRGKPGRKPLPTHLRRVRQIYDLEASEKICACGCQLRKIGEEISEQLDIIPATVQVIQHVKYKYACQACEDTIKTAQGPKLSIPKSIATAGLLAHVSVSKFKDHLPLYRQENIFRRMGVDIARNTLSLWMIKAAIVTALVGMMPMLLIMT